MSKSGYTNTDGAIQREDGISGFLCEKQNADSLYQAMKEMATKSSDEREQMGRTVRKPMEEVFDKKKVVTETIQALMR